MTAKQLFDVFSDHQDDYEFSYKGKNGSVCIFSWNDISVAYDGESTDLKNLDEVMKAPFLAGKSFNDVAEDVILYG